MAITKTHTFNGVQIPNAYFKVFRYEGDKSKTRAEIGVHTSKNLDMFDSLSITFALDLNGDNPVKQSYDYLKTLPEFEGSTDC